MTKIETKVDFGVEYADKISGFKGKAVAITKWQFGCIRVALQPAVDKDGKLPDATWFDEEQLENITPVKKDRGGPTPNPTRNPDM